MSLELVKERIMMDQKIGYETTQIMLESDFIVPDVKPDIKMVLQTDGKVSIEKMEVATERINYSGNLLLNVLYLAKNSEKPVHNMSHTLPIDEYINIDNLNRDMWGSVNCTIVHLECKMLNERKITVKCVIDVKARAYEVKEKDIVINAKGIAGAEFLKNTLKMNRPAENKNDRFVVKDEMTIPSGKPNIGEILQSKTTITNKEVKISDGRVSLKGELLICTLYIGDTDESIVEYIENEIPFNGTIEARDAKDDMHAEAILTIAEQAVQVKPDLDGEERILDIEVTVNADLKISSEYEIETIEDAYCINKSTNLVKSNSKYMKTVCRNKNQSAIKETVQLDQNCPPIMQVYHVTGRTVIDEIKIGNDRVIVEGVVTSDVIYVAESDDTPLFSYSTTIPFKQQIETKGCRENMLVDLDTEITHTAFNMLSPSEVEVRFVINLNAVVYEEKEIELVTDLTLDDLSKEVLNSFASMTVYVVQPGDTLWKIAKKYNTSIADLLELNDIENPSKIFPGNKLLILKKSSEE